MKIHTGEGSHADKSTDTMINLAWANTYLGNNAEFRRHCCRELVVLHTSLC